MADATQDELIRRRTIGRTGVEVTTFGFGAAPIGNLYTAVDDDSAWLAVSAAWDGGVRSFDTVGCDRRCRAERPAILGDR